jgi:GAF domain
MTKSLAAELELLANHMTSENAGNQQLSVPALAERIAENFQVKADEVAILLVSERHKNLQFLVPEALRNVGSIPLSSTSALAARTARESRPDILNNFTAVRHATVFEGVKADSLSAAAIQKIISAPILYEAKVIGVIQISRKAATVAEAGPDFTPDDLGKVLAISKPLGKLIRHVVGS